MGNSANLPGFNSPAVGFEQPFEMLGACHDRVRRSLSLLQRLIRHIDQNGHDEQSRSAAGDVLHYFDLAAPLHHEDEETHVFPRLLQNADRAMAATVQTLQGDHERMTALWQTLRQALLLWRAAGPHQPVDEITRQTAASFCALYATHLETEEGVVFPAAKALVDDATLVAMGAEMQARRLA